MKIFFAVIGIIMLGIGSATAGCNANCRAKCVQAAGRGNTTVEACVAHWSVINAKKGANTQAEEARYRRLHGRQ
jgi:hypothetical protein